MAKPAAHRQDINPGRDQARCVGVPQGVQAYAPAADSSDRARPFAAERVGHQRPTVPRRKYKIGWRASANPECEALFVLRPPMDSQFADDRGGKRHGAQTVFGLWRLEAQAGLCLLERLLDAQGAVIEIDVAPA